MSAVALKSKRKPRAKARQGGAEPFTVEHFKAWAAHLVLDNGDAWVLEPFQLAFVADVFAGYPQCWLILPEGNGKTTLVAGLALYFCEFCPLPSEIPVAASSRDQANILYQQAEGFVLRSPTLHDEVSSKLQQIRGRMKWVVPRFKPLSGFRRVEHFGGSRVQVQAADANTGDGVIFRLAIIDELHRHKNLDLQRTWVGKISKRGGQVVVISTAGEPGGEFETARERIRTTATEIQRAGCFTRAASSEIVMHEWAVPVTGDVEDLALVKQANPFSRITLRSLASKRRDPTVALWHWRRLTCNLPTREDSAAIQETEWESAKTAEAIPAGMPVWVGADISWKGDPTAMLPLWIRDQDFRLFGAAFVLSPPRDGTSLDPGLVKLTMTRIHQRNPIHTVVMNCQAGGPLLVEWIAAEFGAQVVDRPQTPLYAAEDYERFMEGLRNGKLKHSGDVGLTTHVLNAIARVEPANGKTRFDRPHEMRGEAERRVIDALVAAARVHAQALVPVEETPEFHMAVR